MRSVSASSLLVVVTASSLCATAALGQEDVGSDAPAPVPASTDAPAAEPAAPEIPREFVRELRTAEAQVHELKERVFRSKATLQLLRELVVEGSGTGSTLKILHVDDLGRGYAIDGIQYFLDGKSIFAWAAAEGVPAPEGEVPIQEAPISPGTHAVQVTLSLRGDGGKVFDYVEDYRFKVESSYSFDVESGTATELTVKAITRGGVKKAFTDRPTVVYETRSESANND